MAAQAHQRTLQRGGPLQGLQIGGAELLIPEHRLPLELKQAGEVEARAGTRRSRRAALALGGREPRPQPQPRRLAQTAGEQQGKTGLGQQGGPQAHQADQLRVLELQLGRSGLLQKENVARTLAHQSECLYGEPPGKLMPGSRARNWWSRQQIDPFPKSHAFGSRWQTST